MSLLEATQKFITEVKRQFKKKQKIFGIDLKHRSQTHGQERTGRIVISEFCSLLYQTLLKNSGSGQTVIQELYVVVQHALSSA